MLKTHSEIREFILQKELLSDSDDNLIFEFLLSRIPNEKIQVWQSLSDQDKGVLIDKASKNLNNDLVEQRSVLIRVDQYLDSFVFLVLGILIGVMGNLWASFIYDHIKNFEIKNLVTLLFILSLVMSYFVLNFVSKVARRELNEHPLIRRIIEDQDKKRGKVHPFKIFQKYFKR